MLDLLVERLMAAVPPTAPPIVALLVLEKVDLEDNRLPTTVAERLAFGPHQ